MKKILGNLELEILVDKMNVNLIQLRHEASGSRGGCGKA